MVDPIEKLDVALRSAFRSATETVDLVPPGWRTTRQWAELEGMSRSEAGRMIKHLVESGQWEARKFRIKTGSKVYPVPHSRPIPEQRESGSA